MKKIFLVTAVIALIMTMLGCSVTKESITDINQKIQDRYDSFSTLKYTYTESLYENNSLKQQETRTELIKKPDKMKQIINLDANKQKQNLLGIYNGNILYSQITPDSLKIYKYINLPPEMTTYTNYFINKGSGKWMIPSAITDSTKYKVETSKVDYNGKEAIKAIVTTLMSEEAKQKQITIGNTPRESVITYWFDSNSLAILKEESYSFGTRGEVITQKGGTSSVKNVQEIESKMERIYESFYFDIDIPDSEFEIQPSDLPGVKFTTEIVDMSFKLP